MNGLVYEHLHRNLKLLKLVTFESILDNYLEIAAKDGRSTIEIIDYLIDQELQSKEARSQALRMRIASFPMEKRLEDFNFDFQPTLDQAVIKEIASLRFIHNAENIIFLGPPGVGKTHLAIGLGIEAVKAGFRVHFANASSMVEKLERRIKRSDWRRRFAIYRNFICSSLTRWDISPLMILVLIVFSSLYREDMKERPPFLHPINPLANGVTSSEIM